MTAQERIDLFVGKDYITKAEFMQLTGYCDATASTQMATIRRASKRPPAIKGTVWCDDYLDWLKLDTNRLNFLKEGV